MVTDLSTKECLQIISNNYIGHLGYISGSIPIVVPITYYFNTADDKLISYSLEGKKIDGMRKQNSVTFLITEITSVNQWKSVLVHGTFEELSGETAKEQLHQFTKGVKYLVNKEDNMEVQFVSDFSQQIYGEGQPIVYRIKIIDFSGKQRIL